MLIVDNYHQFLELIIYLLNPQINISGLG